MLIKASVRLAAVKVKHLYHRALYCNRSSSDLKILYFGTDNFSLPSLVRLSKSDFSRLEVVTSFKAKNNPVKNFAERNSIKLHDWIDLSSDSNFHICKEFDLGLVVSFGHLIPERIINSFKGGMLNVHASLLPKYRGASPIIYAIKNGEKETGVSVMRIEPKKFDIGEVYATKSVPISDEMLMPELHDILSSAGAELLVDCVTNFDRYPPIPQDNSKATYAPKIDKEFYKVRWREMTADNVFNLYRSIYSFKNIITSFNGEPLKLIEIAKCDLQDEDLIEPGQLKFCKKSRKLLVKCSDDKLIEIRQVMLGKKKAMSAADFTNGYLKKLKSTERRFSE